MLEVVLLKFKKCGFLLSLVTIVCFAFPVLASADSDILSGKKDRYGQAGNLTDNNMSTMLDITRDVEFEFDEPMDISGYSFTTSSQQFSLRMYSYGKLALFEDGTKEKSNLNLKAITSILISPKSNQIVRAWDFKVFGKKYVEVLDDISNITEKVDIDKVTFNWNNPNKSSFTGVKVYRNGSYLTTIGANTLTVNNLESNTDYTFKFVASYGSKEANGVTRKIRTLVDPKKIPPSDVKELKVSDIKEKSLKLDWKNPTEFNFDGTKIYKDGKLLSTVGKDSSSYEVNDLNAGSPYEFKVTSINKLGGETKGVVVKASTKMPVLSPPKSVSISPQDGGLTISWDSVDEKFLKGYNVYIDGKKVNDSPVHSNKLRVNNLDNGKEYKIQVSAVNKDSVEGGLSNVKSEIPSNTAIDYDEFKLPFTVFDLLTSSVSLLGVIGGFLLLAIAIIWFRPLKELIVKAVRREKDKK